MIATPVLTVCFQGETLLDLGRMMLNSQRLEEAHGTLTNAGELLFQFLVAKESDETALHNIACVCSLLGRVGESRQLAPFARARVHFLMADVACVVGLVSYFYYGFRIRVLCGMLQHSTRSVADSAVCLPMLSLASATARLPPTLPLSPSILSSPACPPPPLFLLPLSRVP